MRRVDKGSFERRAVYKMHAHERVYNFTVEEAIGSEEMVVARWISMRWECFEREKGWCAAKVELLDGLIVFFERISLVVSRCIYM